MCSLLAQLSGAGPQRRPGLRGAWVRRTPRVVRARWGSFFRPPALLEFVGRSSSVLVARATFASLLGTVLGQPDGRQLGKGSLKRSCCDQGRSR